MAIYRSDQATVTFALEANPGAYSELAALSGTVGLATNASALTLAGTGSVAGAKTIILSDVVGNSTLKDNSRFMVVVGGTVSGASTQHGPKEVRKVVDGFGTTTLTLDHPLAFDHGTATPVAGKIFHDTNSDSLTTDVLSSPAYTSHDLITWLPGVYEAVDVPDPEQAFEPYYILGSQNRNAYVMYPGQETLAGSIGGMILLNATPLRFPLGNMVTLPSQSTNSNLLVGTAAAAGGAAKGATVVNAFKASSTRAAIDAGTYVVFGSNDGVGVGAEIDATAFSILPNSTYEVRQLMRDSCGSSASATHTLYLDAPLRFAHNPSEIISTVATAATFYHTIWEKTALDSITMNVSVLDSNETAVNTWQRRYVGGKVGAMTIAAEEGGLVNCSWESMLFLDMIHNMKTHEELPTGSTIPTRFMPRYGAMSIINPSSVGKPIYNSTGATYTRPSTAPYYFSQGTVRWFGNDPNSTGDILARLRSFSISIANSEEPRYYLSNQPEGKRGPTEILEQRREYSMSATIAMDDSATAAVGVAETRRNIFKELLLAGDYRGTGEQGLRGFAIELTFARSATDIIQIRIPGESFNDNANVLTDVVAGPPREPAGGELSSEGGKQGAFIRAATHNIGDTNPIEADVDIIFRSMIINIRDSEPVYP